MDFVDTAAAPQLIETWENDWRTRPSYIPVERRGNFARWASFVMRYDGADVGVIAMGAGSQDRPAEGTIADIWVTAARRRRGHATAALPKAEHWLGAAGASRVLVQTDPDDEAHQRLFDGYPPFSRHMVLEVGDDRPPRPEGVKVNPMTDAEYEPWKENVIKAFATLQSRQDRPSKEALQQARQAYDSSLPEGRNTPGHGLLSMRLDGEYVAGLWVFHDQEADEIYVYDVVVDQEFRGRGLGRVMMDEATRLAVDRNLSRVRLHVHEHNSAAVSLYENMGYGTVARYRVMELSGDIV